MAQITIYLPDAIEDRARRAARMNGTSVSRWIADQVSQRLEDAWPKAVLDAAGALPEFPSVEEIRRKHGRDAPRESLK